MELAEAVELIEDGSTEHRQILDEALATLKQLEAAGGDLESLAAEQPLPEALRQRIDATTLKVAGGTL